MGDSIPKTKTTAKKRKWRRRLLIVGGMFAVGIAVAYWTILSMMPSAIIYAPNADKEIDPARDPDAASLHQLGVSRHLRVQVGPPAASLSCWVIDPPQRQQPRGTVLALHGIRDSKRSLLSLGRRLASAGFRAVVPDHRGHGRSTGKWLSFGAVESKDLVQLMNHLESKRLLAPPVGAMGFSYGAATAIQLAGRDRRVKAVVAVASFTDLHQVVRSYIRFYVPVLGSLIPDSSIDDAVAEAGEQAGFDPRAASPLRSIRTSRARVLLIYGGQDRRIPPDNGRALHRAAPRLTELIVVPEMNHATILGDRTGTVNREGMKWLARWLRRE